MNRKNSVCRLVCLVFAVGLFALVQQASGQTNRVFYAGKAGDSTAFNQVYRLSDGTFLVSGQTYNLGWTKVTPTILKYKNLPSGSNSSVLGINSFADANKIAFLLHLAPDLNTVLHAVQWPAGTAGDINKIKTNTAPGQPTGNLFISGKRDNEQGSRWSAKGWYIAKLNRNFINGVPDSLTWIHEVAGGNDQKVLQPFDVDNQGRFVVADGIDSDWNWNEIHRIAADGITLDTMPGLHNHDVILKGTYGRGSVNPIPPQGTFPQLMSLDSVAYTHFNEIKGDSVYVDTIFVKNNGIKYAINFAQKIAIYPNYLSRMVLKSRRTPHCNRSVTMADFNQTSTDENGNPGRKGKYPEDYFFLDTTLTDGGFNGYSLAGGSRVTQRVGSIAIDRRNNDVYLGIAANSNSSDPFPNDREPVLTALNASGQLKWWARMYQETPERSDARQSINFLDIDYTNNQLVIGASTAGKAKYNFWKGNEIANNPGGNGFQNAYTGSPLNDLGSPELEIAWLGKYGLNDGKVKFATYVGEFADSTKGTAHSDPNLDGWANQNTADNNLSATSINGLFVTSDGKVIVTGKGARTVTTKNAFQRMLKFDQGKSSVQNFARVYSYKLDSVLYSTTLTGVWSGKTGNGSNNTRLTGIWPVNGGMLLAGAQNAQGSDIPVTGKPAWGDTTANVKNGVLAWLNYTCATGAPNRPDSIYSPAATVCSGLNATYFIRKVAGAQYYQWFVDGAWKGTSTDTSITLSSNAIPGKGSLTVAAINACGSSLQRSIDLAPALSKPATPGSISVSKPAYCVGDTIKFSVTRARGVTGFGWIVSKPRWVPLTSIQPLDSVVKFIVPAGPDTANLAVYAINACGNSTLRRIKLEIPGTPAQAIASVTGPSDLCVGRAGTFTVPTVAGQTNIWTLPTNWTGNPGTGNTASITPTAAAANPGAPDTLVVQGKTPCGLGPKYKFVLPKPVQAPNSVTITRPRGDSLFAPTGLPILVLATYQWKLAGNNIAGATKPQLKPTSNGNYTLVVTLPCGISITSNGILVTAISEQLAGLSLNIYPNPTSNLLQIETGTDKFSLVLTDLMGKVLHSEMIDGNIASLNLDNLPAGMYSLSIETELGRVSRMVNKQ